MENSHLPFRSHYQTIQGYRMHYVDEGQGEPVLLLHGNPTWSFFYRRLIQSLSPYMRVIAPDYIGCGLSDHPKDAHFRAADRVNQVEQFLEKLEIGKFSLVMHDWGGPIGTMLAVKDPARVNRIVYLNTTLSEVESLPGIIRTAASPVVGKIVTLYTNRFVKLMLNFGSTKRLSREVRRGYLYPYRKTSKRMAIWDFVADIPWDSRHPSYNAMLDMAAKLPSLENVPVKIIWGLRDPCFHREMLAKVAQHFPHAEVVEIPDASHLVLEDAPEVAIPAIRDFFLPGSVAVERETLIDGDIDKDITVHSRAPNSFAQAFMESVEAHRQHDAVVEPRFVGETVRYLHTNFESLRALSVKYRRGLIELGLNAGDKVLMLVPPGPDFLALGYAVMAHGAIPVFVDPGIGNKKLCRCIADCRPDVMIGVPRAHLLRLLRPSVLRGLKFHVTVSDWFLSGGPNLSYLKRFSSAPLELGESDGTALIAFTSGATGTPKGVMYTNKMVQAQLDILRNSFGMEGGKLDCPLLPIFALFNAALGIGSVFPPVNPAQPLSLDPARLVKIVNDCKVTYSFGSPTLWNKIAEYAVRSGASFPSLQRVFMAGAPVSKRVLELVTQVLPHGDAFTPYGATEALPVTLVAATELQDHSEKTAITGERGIYVGKPVAGIEARVVRTLADRAVSDAVVASGALEVLPVGEIGEIIVRGANVSPRYLNRPDATWAAKISEHSAETGRNGFWHRMGDVGYFDEHGGLYLCGRRVHAVHYEGRVYYSLPTERMFNEHPKVRRSALIVGRGGKPAIAIEPEPGSGPNSTQAQTTLEAELLQWVRGQAPRGMFDAIEEIYFFESFPVDARHNAKIFRDKLSEWAAKKAA